MILIVANKNILFYSGLLSHICCNEIMQLLYSVNKASESHVFMTRKQILIVCQRYYNNSKHY
jgi:hypothetical protein